jgi:hypothetical protein
MLGRGHLLLQFDGQPSAEAVQEMTRRGVMVLEAVPENGLVVSLAWPVPVHGMGLRYAAPIDPADKISPMIAADYLSGPAGYYLVEFHSDVDLNYGRALLLTLGIELHENPDLAPHQLMIQTDGGARISDIASLDEVSYIFPASEDLVKGAPAIPCAGAITGIGVSGQFIPTYGPGWTGAAPVYYVFSKMTAKLDPAATQAEILRAMAEWAKAVQVTWKPGPDPNGARTVNILFATGAHGDSYPFDASGAVVAHTFFPAPPNAEPIAGDMHFDDVESWRIGANIDVFSVALHELGHALGLGHSDNPDAVMYPYYKMNSGLSSIDIGVARTLYAAPGSVTPPAVTASLTLTVNPVAASTGASSIGLSGTASGGKVTWTTGHGASGAAQASGVAWNISSVPLVTGSNTITVTATDSASHVSQSITVTRQTTADTTAPTLTITKPSATTISTSAASIVFSGTASDNVGVTGVTWATNTGGSGTATGTTNWSASIPLLVGSNQVTIRALDAAGNVGWRTATVTRH